MAPLRRYRPVGLSFQIFFPLVPIAVLVSYKAASDNMKAATKKKKKRTGICCSSSSFATASWLGQVLL